jgi:ABC-type glycerol-3-phosphate transport system substrate-binding protein
LQKEPQLQDRFGFCKPPGSRMTFDYESGKAVEGVNFVPYLGAGGWVAVVPRTNPSPEAAFALATRLADPQTSREMVIEPAWGGGVFRRAHLQGDKGWDAFGLENRTADLLRIFREVLVHPQVKNPVTRLRIPDERAHQAALLAEVRECLLHGKDPAKALEAALLRWQELDRNKPRRSEYRLSIGLSVEQ